MRTRSVPTALVAAAALVSMLVAGCGPGSAASLTDPREILTRTLAATANLRTVTIRAELQVRDANRPAAGIDGVDGGVLEAQADLVASEFSARLLGANGVEVGRAVAVDGSLFGTSGGNGRWQQTPVTPEMLANPSALLLFGGFGGAPGAGPDIVGIIGQALQGPALRLALVGVEDCGSRRCYRTTVDIPADGLWPLIVQLLGLDRVPGIQPPAPGDLPQISLSILSDTETLQLVELAGAGSLQAVTGQLRIQLAEHDGPVSIQPPPAELVDPAFGGGVPMPAPARPAPEPTPIPAATPAESAP